MGVPLFDQLFSSPLLVTLPFPRWEHRKVDLDGLQNVVYTEVQHVPDFMYPKTAKPSKLLATKLVDKVTVTLMGKSVENHLKGWWFSQGFLCLKDIEELLNDLHKLCLCGGGPSTKVFTLAHPICASVNSSAMWRHNSCLLSLGNEPECQNCACLSDTLRIHRSRLVKRKKKNKPQCAFCFPSVPSSEKIMAFRKAKYALKRFKTCLLKK